MFRLYDTRHRRIEEIEVRPGGLLRMYTCGPTTYRSAHVGDLRSYLLADLIRRNAERRGLTVLGCRSITDVGYLADDAEIDGRGVADGHGEDEILAQARAEGTAALEAARRYEGAFRADCAALNIAPPDHEPRTSESIGLITDLIARLLAAGHAYAAPDGSVYFDARSFPGYGEISGTRLDDPRPGRRSGGEAEPAKRFSADWALWAGAPADRSLTWPAPWGHGFPGPHAGCSAMSVHYLGETIDIHTGDIGLRFPHHENERAQSDSAAGHEVVRHWVHGEHLLFDGREMAESAGNVVLLGDLADRGLDPLALRLAFLQRRYRQQLNLTWPDLAAADRALRGWRDRVAQWATASSRPMCARYSAEVADAFDDDLDTPAALRSLGALERDEEIPPGSKFESFAAADRLLALDLTREVGRPQQPVRGGQTRAVGHNGQVG
jgi:cysteinyl-tRNA synthetase